MAIRSLAWSAFCFLTLVVSAAAQEIGYTESFAASNNLTAEWCTAGDLVNFRVTANATGWVGLGFSDDQLMPNSDIIQVNGNGEIQDGWATVRGAPELDISQEAFLRSAIEAGDQTIVEFSRPIVTGDDHDLALDSDRFLLWAFNSNQDEFGSRHSDRGFSGSMLNFSTAAACTTGPAPNGKLVAYYNFDDGQTVTDQIGAHHGTVIHNAGFNVDTPDGSPFSLDLTADGVGPDQDYVRIGPAADEFGEPDGRDFGISETNSFTISAWVNYSQSERGVITIKQDLTSSGTDRSGVTFGIDAEENLFIGIIASTEDEFGDEANTGATFRDIKTDDFVPTGEWAHIAATYDFDSDTLVAYINGLASESYTVNPVDSINDDGTDITLGAGIDWFDNDGSFTGFGASGNGPEHADSAGDFTRLFYDGLLDDVGIWDMALSADQIASLANGSKKPPEILGASVAGDFNGNGSFDVEDIILLGAESASGNNTASFDLTGDGLVNQDDVATWITAPAIGNSWVGDSNFDGEFNSGDLVQIFQAGKFEQDADANWSEGDWTGDGRFNSGDLVAAFQDGGFERGPRAASTVPEPSSLVLLVVALSGIGARRRW